MEAWPASCSWALHGGVPFPLRHALHLEMEDYQNPNQPKIYNYFLFRRSLMEQNYTYDEAQEPIVVSKATMDLFLKSPKPGDLMSLYFFYYYTAKWQKTNQPKATTGYSAKGLKWSENRVRQAKKELIKLGLIENIVIRDPKTKSVTGHYIGIKFLWAKATLTKSTGWETHPNENPQCGKTHSVGNRNTNALSANSINALSANKENILFTNKFVNDLPDLLSDWPDREYGYKFDILYSFRNGDWPKKGLKNYFTASLINPYQKIPDTLLAKYLRFSLTAQETIQRNAPAKSTHFSGKQLAQHILVAVTEIDKLCRLDHFDFEACIKPALKWAVKDPFWSDQILSLSNLRNKGKNGLSKFFNLYNAWCKAEQIDPKLGRLGKKSDFIDHGYYGD